MATKPLRIVDADGGTWATDDFHGVHRADVGADKHWWRRGPEGIVLIGSCKPLRTKGKPVTATRIQKTYGWLIENLLGRLELPVAKALELVIGMVATESGGRPTAAREEKAIHDWSFGLTQTLTRTAKGIEKAAGVKLPARSIPKGGSVAEWRTALSDAETSLRLGIAYLALIEKQFKCQGDPILIYAGYNSGSPRPSRSNPWGLVAYDRDGMGPALGALDWFARWYGDACAVVYG